MFTTVDKILGSLRSSVTTDAERAQFATSMGSALTQLDRSLEHVSSVRAEVGARLSMLDATESTRQDRELELQSSLSQVRDLDYAAAIAQLNLQQAGLQAAQASYARLAQLSLFDYLR
jgi:flagellar hook-associated protein 3 FlgL